ncbi:hypothetical protein HYPSUDRAFT_41567 [Hypholoma sublateritium FD-334 SS-4]|uniref:Uncharacterized protein n=1 Tax=Hypholoma sublateritium (strain FD-334 SS-4) TaxID=945553 RepID=A0A0D2PPW5_HYPSF|nr:hypothetical protein HYPSUDRAFT_41567 [Hypholoma sublateritium FD-334 SS-4]
MPVASTSKRVDRRAVAKRPRRAQIPRARPSKMLRVTTEPETHALKEALHAPSILEYNFENLEKPCEYPFKARDLVWVRTKGDKWMSGKVSGRVRVGPTRNQEQGFWYHVNFGPKFNVRKYFAPMNGEIKPDTHEVRQLLRDEGWIASDSEMSDDSEYTE